MRMPSERSRFPRQSATALGLCLLPLSLNAAGPVVPGAGSILQQTQPVLPPGPSGTGTGLTIEQPDGGALPPSAPFVVKSFELSGNTAFDTPTLHALLAEAEGKTLTLTQLGQIAARVTEFYRNHGYPLARAIIPTQSIRDGVVRIQVIEARYGRIALDNHSRVVDSLLRATLAPLQGGQAISDAALNHALLLLADIPGVAAIATLKPGEMIGTSDLLVQTEPTAALTGNVALDNDGNRYTGRARLGGTVSLIDPAQHGDTLSLTGQTSGDMDYANLGYEALINGAGTRLGGSYSALRYVLGDTLAALDGHGSAEVESFWVKQPLLRTPLMNLYGQIQFDRKQLDDAVGASDLHTNRHLDNGTASVTGDLRDSLLSGGINTWSLDWTMGRVGFDDAGAQLADAASANTQGRFSQWTASVSRLQHVVATDAVYVALSAQWSNANLDPAQKMVVGGAYTVRAYDMAVLSADTGILASAEWRHELGLLCYGQFQAIGFIDSDHVTINHTVWASGPNSATLNGVGAGLNWSRSGQWNAKASIAVPLGSTPALISANNSARIWLALSKGF
jgi:hemolysin activation/secretion protein